MTEYADQLNDLTLTNTDQLIAPTIDWELTVLLTERRTENWLTDCLKDWETDNWLTDCLKDWETDNWLTDRLSWLMD